MSERSGTGQRASDSSLHWGVDAIWAQLVPLLPGLSVEVVGRIGSTNTALLERARVVHDERPVRSGDTVPGALSASEGAVQVRRSIESRSFGRRAVDMQPCLLIAENQTAGRGRMGRPWQATAGGSLTFSLAMTMRRADLSGLSLAVGVVLADALDPSPHLPQGDSAPGRRRFRIGIKWPNDLWLLYTPPTDGAGLPACAEGRKLGGVLIETTGTGDQRMLVIGIGLNVLPMPTPEAATTGFACLQEVDADMTVQSALSSIVLPLVQALKGFERTGYAPFAPLFAARDILFQCPVTTTLHDPATGGFVRGLAQGVLPDGALCVQTPHGLQAIRGGEVSVRPDHHAAFDDSDGGDAVTTER